MRFAALLIALLAIPLFEAARAQGQVWPDNWVSQDVGDVGAAGSAELVGTRLTVRGSGADVWGTGDEFHFAHTTIRGDFALTAYVAHVEDVDRWTKAGLTIRDGLAANARHAFLFATPRTERGIAFQRRPVTGGTSVHTAGPATTPPVWLRLTRRGDFVAAALRASETDEWTQIGEQRFTGLPLAVNVGFAVSSHVDGYPAEAWFEQLPLNRRRRPVGRAATSAMSALTASRSMTARRATRSASAAPARTSGARPTHFTSPGARWSAISNSRRG